MKWFAKALAAFAAAAALAANAAQEGPRPSRVDFTSRPEGANVYLDGALRGATPLTLFDVSPGEHHARFEPAGRFVAGYEPADEYLSVAEGSHTSCHAELKPMRGLLLVTSEPSGASITVDKVSLGETPRLVTTLDANRTYKVVLQKTGYQPRTAEVRFSGRTPAVVHERLVLDSGVLKVTSEPSGAEVTLNGVSRGLTPVTVSDVPKGNGTLKVSLAGHKVETRDLNVSAGDVQEIAVQLRPIPGRFSFTSVPSGARIYLDGAPRGRTPVDIRDVAPGEHSVRAEMTDYGDVFEHLFVGLGETVRHEFRLESSLGRLEIRTKPAGVQVLLDGQPKGTTHEGARGISETMTISGVKEGEHTLTFRCAGHAEARRTVRVERGAAAAVDVGLVKVFTPNIKVNTASTTYVGELASEGPDSIEIWTSPGVKQRFMRSEIRSVEAIEPKK